MVRHNARAIGAAAEERACRYLIAQGLQPVERNFQCRLGEIDLIMLDNDCLVFVEVRYRGGRRISPASLTVDTYKQRKLIRTAAMYLARRSRFADCKVRFDVTAIDGESMEWLRDAFRPADASL